MSPISIDEAFLSSNPLPLHEEESDKQSRGRVLIVAGSREVPRRRPARSVGSTAGGSRHFADSHLPLQCGVSGRCDARSDGGGMRRNRGWWLSSL